MFETIDVDEARDGISTILQPHRLTPMYGWRSALCHLDYIPVGDMGIGTIGFGETQVHVPELADYHLFIACLTGHAHATVEQKDYRIDRTRGLIIAPGEQMLATFSPDCEQIFVRIGKRAIERHSGIHHLQFRRSVDLGAPALVPWLHQIATIASDPQTSRLIETRAEIAAEYEQLLLSLLLAGQAHHDAQPRGCTIAPRSVKRAEDFIHSRFADPLSLADIAEASGVPTRTLLDSFRNFRGTSPIRYLRNVRLDHARLRLIRGETETVAEAAMESGLMHLGRFSREYWERFGEKPSETLCQGRLLAERLSRISFSR